MEDSWLFKSDEICRKIVGWACKRSFMAGGHLFQVVAWAGLTVLLYVTVINVLLSIQKK